MDRPLTTTAECYRELCEVLTAARQIDVARYQAESRIHYLRARLAELQAAEAKAKEPPAPAKQETTP